jgi:hypothetical protein
VHQPIFFILHRPEQLTGGLVVGILRNQLASYREIEDCLTKLLGMFGARGEARKMVKIEALSRNLRFHRFRHWFHRCSVDHCLSCFACIASSHRTVSQSSTFATIRRCSARWKGKRREQNSLSKSSSDQPFRSFSNSCINEIRGLRKDQNIPGITRIGLTI